MVETPVTRSHGPWPSKSNSRSPTIGAVLEPRTIDELVRSRAKELPDATLVSYPHHELDYIDYSARKLDQYAYHVAKRYTQYLQPRTTSSTPTLVVALLGLSSLDYLVTAMAVMKLGHTALHLSTRISHEAYIDLLTRTQAVVLLVDDAMQHVAQKCKTDIPDIAIGTIAAASEYIRPEVPNLDTNMTLGLDVDEEQSTVAWVIHSSGSTGLPKPIYQTQRAAMNNYKGNMNMRGFITLPLYHAHGIASTFRAIYSSKQIHLYNARIPLTKQYLIEVMRRYDFEIFYGVPYVLKLLAEDQEGIELLALCKVVMFGGSACPDELGDTLVENGVNLVSHWGSTETGQLMTSFRPPEDKAWSYLRPSDAVKPYLCMEPRGEGLFEAVCLPGWPSKVATNQPDGSYAMKDLFTKHPRHDWWRYYGRLDDTIVLVNGEKAMPLPIEGAARRHPLVSEAVVFGKGRDRLGLALIRSPSSTQKTANDIVQEVLASIEKTQMEMPAYARISSDMVMVLDADTEYPQTDKGTVIRMKFYKRFEKDIDQLYETVKEQRGTLQLDEAQLRTFIRDVLQDSLINTDFITDDQDFFNAGMDSLQATRLRTAIAKNLDVGDNPLGINVAFEYPTISKLARYLYCLRTGHALQTKSNIEDEMQELFDRFNNFERPRPQSPPLDANVVILTGVTGSLGAHMVSTLVHDESISKVYCLIRAASDEEAQQRLSRSLTERGLADVLPLAPSKLVALSSNFARPDLGLPQSTLDTLKRTTRAIIHSAWSVNFNLSLHSFEDCIGSVHNLIQLALSTSCQTTFAFCSSVSTVMRTPSPPGHITETLPPFAHAQSMGYAQSKLVAEHLCAHASTHYGVDTCVLRIGQIVGDTARGVWNAKEAIPTMLQSAMTLGVMPTLDENVRWLPVDLVARTCVSVALSSLPPLTNRFSSNEKSGSSSRIYNVLNPHTLNWTHDILPFLRSRCILEFDSVSVSDWLDRLQRSDPDPERNPPVKLLGFWREKYGRSSCQNKQNNKGEKKEYTWDITVFDDDEESRVVNREAVLDVLRLSLGYFRAECW